MAAAKRLDDWAVHEHGIAEGQEWHGTLRPGSQEITVLGDAVDHAVQISNFAKDGAIWVTRSLVSKLRTRSAGA